MLSVGTVPKLSTWIALISGNGTFQSILEILLGSSHVAAVGETLILVLDTLLNWQHYQESWGKVGRGGTSQKVTIEFRVPS